MASGSRPGGELRDPEWPLPWGPGLPPMVAATPDVVEAETAPACPWVSEEPSLA